MKSAWILALSLLVFGCKKKPAPAAAGSASGAALAGAPASSAVPGAPSGLAILEGFEGRISWRAQGKLSGERKQPLDLSLLVKDAKFRLELPPEIARQGGVGNAYLLGHPKDKRMYAIVEAQKQAIVFDFEKLGSGLDGLGSKLPGAPAAAETPPVITKTGRMDRVAGYACEIWTFEHQASKSEMCIAAEGTSWFHLPLSKLDPKYAWAAELADGKHFPLRFVAFDKAGAEEGRIELTGIKKEPVAAAQLEVPAGYQQVDFQQMMHAMMGGLHGKSGLPPGLPPGFKLPKPQ